MAGVQTNADSRGEIRFAVFLGAVVLGGSLVCGQVPSAPPEEPTEQVVEVRVTGNKRTEQSPFANPHPRRTPLRPGVD